MRNSTLLIAILAAAWPTIAASQDVSAIPLVGDETAANLIKASPRDFLMKPVAMVGLASVSDYYNYDYREARDSHFSITLRQIVPSGGRPELGEFVHLYIRRSELTSKLVERIAANSRTIASGFPLRVRVMHLADRFDPMNWDLIELLDVQLLDARTGKWGPWVVAEAVKEANAAKRMAEMLSEARELEERKAREAEAARAEEARKAALTREWKDTTGRFSITAEFGGVLGGQVKLLKPDGDSILVPIDRLSEPDKAWLRNRRP
jgi:hypothetical protein